MNDAWPRRYADEVLGGAADGERRRLAAMAAVCDPVTTHLLDELGVAAGWRCLEVGAGAGSVAAWLADRVTAAGQVTATDIDLSHLAGLSAPGLSVLRHDVTRDPAPPGAPFDLVHARFVLEHLPEREQVLDRLVSWLRPGGTIVVESIASFPVASSPNPTFRQAMTAIEQVLARTIGTDSTWARGFPGPLRSRHLVDVGTSSHLPTTGGANASACCWALTLSRLRPHILSLGLATADTVDRALDLLADPAFFDLSFATAIAWGRAPD
ncbi:Methyltransferase type 12 [Parafrankia sp. EAN1pec]|uniref:class I SAM-dependent methyltransferase n=1 Tax=Parafrankia sp. (strain EAN1pec) TaxID=298653 RepID=UPI00005436C9|nr:Methyltransferase type 12 [Frankia sp. EAN1pec]